jgi:UDP-N-acetylmuramyl pentapeptide phosphotransferase/UDP-N-acetylglucosamine-1-phosphate transferase
VAGGPVLLLSIGVTLLAAFLCSGEIQKEMMEKATPLIGLTLAAVGICALGILDDLGRLRGRHKLMGQLIAVCAVIVTGVRIDHVYLLNGVDAELGIMAIPFTVFFLLGSINSLNLLDGMDGLLASLSCLLCLFLGAHDLLAHDYHVTLTTYAAFVTAAALLAFLRYNFPPATIFLGDSGSMLIGLIVGVLAIKTSLKKHGSHPEVLVLSVPIALLILPILDSAAAILRRKLTGQSIYSTDRSGLVPPRYQERHAGTNFGAAPFSLGLLGAYALAYVPAVRPDWHVLTRSLLTAPVVTAGFLLGLFADDFNEDADRCQGWMWRVVQMAPSIHERSLLLLVLAPVGMLSLLYFYLRARDQGDSQRVSLLYLGLFLWLLAQISNPCGFQRYYEVFLLTCLSLLAARYGAWDRVPRWGCIGLVALSVFILLVSHLRFLQLI